MSHEPTPPCLSCEQPMMQDADESLQNDEATYQCENVDCPCYLEVLTKSQRENREETEGLADMAKHQNGDNAAPDQRDVLREAGR